MEPYYADDLVTLWLGDCREVTGWLAADVLVTDPPYGRGWKQGRQGRRWDGRPARHADDSHGGIQGDQDTSVRDDALTRWSGRVAAVFGDLTLPPPSGTKLTLIYRKPPNSGVRGAMGGFRRDAEAIYLLGPWPSALGGRSSVIETAVSRVGWPNGASARYGHPHAKPVDVMETLISACPDGVIADPFAGSGSTLVAARNLGRRAVGVEVHEPYAEAAARRLSQGVLMPA